jgi:hypothetical protein
MTDIDLLRICSTASDVTPVRFTNLLLNVAKNKGIIVIRNRFSEVYLGLFTFDDPRHSVSYSLVRLKSGIFKDVFHDFRKQFIVAILKFHFAIEDFV